MHPCTRKIFLGVYAANRLPFNIRLRPCIVIANTDSDNRRGAHWVCFFIPEHENGIEFFCSLGRDPCENSFFVRFIARNGGLLRDSKSMIQNRFSDLCGEYCCIFAFNRVLGLSFTQFLHYFNGNTKKNDKKAFTMFNRYFTCNAHFERKSLRHFHSQSCAPPCHANGRRCTPTSPPLTLRCTGRRRAAR